VTQIDLTSPEAVGGIDYLVTINIIASARAATIPTGAPHG